LKQQNEFKEKIELYHNKKENGNNGNMKNALDESLLANTSKLTEKQLNNSTIDLNDKEDFKNINIKKEIEADEEEKFGKNKHLKFLEIPEISEVELKINDEVFNDLKTTTNAIIKKKKAPLLYKKISPSYSQKMNNLLKIIDPSQSMTLNDSLNIYDKNVNFTEVKGNLFDSTFILENGKDEKNLNFSLKMSNL